MSNATPEATTPLQLAVLRFICASIDANQRPPSLREICRYLGIKSTNGANDHLKALERKGWISREKLISRGIRVLVRPEAVMR